MIYLDFCQVKMSVPSIIFAAQDGGSSTTTGVQAHFL